MAAYRKPGRFYKTPDPGDIVFWSYGQGHVEFVEPAPMDGRSLICIGGDASAHDGSPDNGGDVTRNRRT